MSTNPFGPRSWDSEKPPEPVVPTVTSVAEPIVNKFDNTIDYSIHTPSYIPFNKRLRNITSINEQQKHRNFAFEEFILFVTQAAEVLLETNIIYVLEKSPDNSIYTQPNYARIKIPSISKTWEGALLHYHMDAWSPMVAAKGLISRARFEESFRSTGS